MKAYLLIQTATASRPIAWELQDIDGVSFAQDLTGPYDAIVFADSIPKERPLEAIIAEIQRVPGVTRTLAAPVIGSMSVDPHVEVA